MGREVIEHPSYGWVSASRVMCNRGQTLMGSAHKPHHIIALTISKSHISIHDFEGRDFSDHNIYPGEDLVEVYLTEEQFMQLYTKMNHSGTPATISKLHGKRIPECNYQHPIHTSRDNFRTLLIEKADLAEELDNKVEELLQKPRVTKSDLKELRSYTANIKAHLRHNIPYYLDLITEFSQKTMEGLTMQAMAQIKEFGISYRKVLKAMGLGKKNG